MYCHLFQVRQGLRRCHRSQGAHQVRPRPGRPGRRVRPARLPAQCHRLNRPRELRPPPSDHPGQPAGGGGGGPVRATQAGAADVLHPVSLRHGLDIEAAGHDSHGLYLEADIASHHYDDDVGPTPDHGDCRGATGGCCGEAAATERDGAAAADRGVDDLAGRQLRRHGGRHQGWVTHTFLFLSKF